MIKKEIYPKTERIKLGGIKVEITEKIDGSNLCFFKLGGELYIAMRSNIVSLTDLESDFDQVKDIIYPDLKDWLAQHGKTLKDSLNEHSAICGEWIAMGKLKYPDLDKKFYMFAKANVYGDMNLVKLKYEHDLFIYPFVNQEIPTFIGVIPLVEVINFFPSVEYLNELYEKYNAAVGRPVEGFIVNFDSRIAKYVRMKRGKVEDHFDRK